MPIIAAVQPEADYIIVGGGSAGAVVASRLSEDPRVRVTLVEAGGESDRLLIQIPAGFARIVNNPTFDWCYETEPDPTTHGRNMNWPGGKMLGGGSSLNGLVFIRGTRRDFDSWAEAGATGWGYDDVLPYFMRAETWHGEPCQNRGQSGPIDVAPMRDPHPLCRYFLRACQEMGVPIINDYNADTADGAYLTQTNQRGGWRCSTEKAYLRPARSRANLQILTGAFVERINIRDGRAVGVTLVRQNERMELLCKGEIIVCAGAIASPVLLMRSGIGDPAHLASVGIVPAIELPGVGRNLQDHPNVVQQKKVSQRTLNQEIGGLDMIRHLTKFAFGRRGPLSSPAVQAMGLVRSDRSLPEPDIQLVFMPLGYDILPETKSAASARMAKESAVGIASVICRPYGRGRITLGSGMRPTIEYRMYDDPRDIATMIAGQRYVDRLFKTSAFHSLVVGDRVPNPVPRTDQEWEDVIRWKTTTAFHASGTCRMGKDDGAVLDPHLKVRGISGLRVADASVMPLVPSVNINAATIMIGEKAAEMIRQDAR